MPLAAQPSRARKPAPGPQILAALLAGKNLDEIAKEQQLPRKRVEKVLRDELRRRWAPPPEDYARLQIARLERMSAGLSKKAEEGDPRAIERLLRVADRLDRYHGFSKFMPAASNDHEGAHERLLAKINSTAARVLGPPPEESP
ncbi:MAG: hypothetical protein WAV18_04600 [Roseiarcus sp.]